MEKKKTIPVKLQKELLVDYGYGQNGALNVLFYYTSILWRR